MAFLVYAEHGPIAKLYAGAYLWLAATILVCVALLLRHGFVPQRHVPWLPGFLHRRAARLPLPFPQALSRHHALLLTVLALALTLFGGVIWFQAPMPSLSGSWLLLPLWGAVIACVVGITLAKGWWGIPCFAALLIVHFFLITANGSTSDGYGTGSRALSKGWPHPWLTFKMERSPTKTWTSVMEGDWRVVNVEVKSEAALRAAVVSSGCCLLFLLPKGIALTSRYKRRRGDLTRQMEDIVA